jgi:hypothetical protein
MSQDTGNPQKVDKVQVNVRVPVPLREAIDARRKELGLSRDEWAANAFRLALRQPTRPPAVVRRPTAGVRRPAVLRGETRRAGSAGDSSST